MSKGCIHIAGNIIRQGQFLLPIKSLSSFFFFGGGGEITDRSYDIKQDKQCRIYICVCWFHRLVFSDRLNANSNCYWSHRTVTPRTFWSCQILYWSYKFFFHIKRKKTLHTIHRKHLFLFISSSFISKTCGTFLRGNLLTRLSPNIYWLCRTIWGLLLLALSHFGNFLLAWGHRATVSVEPCQTISQEP